MSKFWWLPAAQLQQVLSPAELSELYQLMQTAHYDADKVVSSSDLPGDAIYLLRQGQVKLLQKTRVPTARCLCHLGTGDLFGMLGLIDIGLKGITVISESRTEILVLRKAGFEKLMKYKPDLSARLVEHLQGYLAARRQIRLSESRPRYYRRISRFLSHYLDHPDYALQGQFPDFNYHPQELADLTGTPVELVEDCLNLMEAQGILRISHHQLQLCNRQALLDAGT